VASSFATRVAATARYLACRGSVRQVRISSRIATASGGTLSASPAIAVFAAFAACPAAACARRSHSTRASARSHGAMSSGSRSRPACACATIIVSRTATSVASSSLSNCQQYAMSCSP